MIKQALYSQNKTIKADKSNKHLKLKPQCFANLLTGLMQEDSKSPFKRSNLSQQRNSYESQITGMENTKAQHQKTRSPEMAQVFKSPIINLGILIDDNYSFVLSEWKQNKIEGPFFMVYPDQSILYGFIENQQIGQFVCYEVNKEFNMILSKNSSVLLVDLLPSNSILVFKVDKKLLEQHTLSSILKRKNQKQINDQINSGIQLLSQQEYSSIQQKYKIYQKKLSISNIPDYLKNYEQFIKQKFNSTQQKTDLIEMVKTRQDLTISFKNCAITLFMKLYLQNNQTKMIGSMNRYQNAYEFYRKIMHNSNSVEECVTKMKGTFTVEYNLRPIIRPKSCEIELCNFHRSAVTYVNQFLNLNYMYIIKQNLYKVNELINIFVTNKLAQVQLQNSFYDPHPEESARKSGPINYTLQQVQQQIYGAVQRKRQSTGKKLYPGVSPSRVSQYPTYPNKSNEKYSRSQIKNIDTAAKNTNSPYMKALHGQDDFYESRLNRSKSYMNVSNITKNYQPKATPTKNTPNKTVNQYTASGKKYSYLDDIQVQKFQPPRVAKSPVKYDSFQNIKRLTEDYEHIQKEIELSTPKQSRSPYRLDNSIYRNSALKQNDADIYNQSTNVKHAPLSQKKVFKYLPN